MSKPEVTTDGHTGLPEDAFEYRDGQVWKKPVRTKSPDGSTSIQVGSPVCAPTEWCDGDTLAKVLCAGEAAPDQAALVKERDEDVVKHMVDRFLMWRLPETFSPDGGIEFRRLLNEGTPHQHEFRPVGTNLLDATQARAMVLHMLEGVPQDAELARERSELIDYCSMADMLATNIEERAKSAEAERDSAVAALREAEKAFEPVVSTLGFAEWASPEGAEAILHKLCANHWSSAKEALNTTRKITSGEAPVQDGWRDIESAPKDGTEILAYRRDQGVFTIHFVDGGELLGLPEREWSGAQWWTTGGGDLSGCMPTHWRPLPLPPSEGEK